MNLLERRLAATVIIEAHHLLVGAAPRRDICIYIYITKSVM